MFKKKKKKDRREKRIPRTYGGYPSGDKAIEDFRPPPASWLASPASKPADNQHGQETPAKRV